MISAKEARLNNQEYLIQHEEKIQRIKKECMDVIDNKVKNTVKFVGDLIKERSTSSDAKSVKIKHHFNRDNLVKLGCDDSDDRLSCQYYRFMFIGKVGQVLEEHGYYLEWENGSSDEIKYTVFWSDENKQESRGGGATLTCSTPPGDTAVPLAKVVEENKDKINDKCLIL